MGVSWLVCLGLWCGSEGLGDGVLVKDCWCAGGWFWCGVGDVVVGILVWVCGCGGRYFGVRA